ncbi:MAG: hypothetical protein R6U70_03140 [Bacillota bacterium]
MIVVKTYPTPSVKYRETVCTAGISDAGKWIRMYPLPYRFMPRVLQFHKYQYIEVKLKRSTTDRRQESYRPDVSSIRSLGPPLPTDNGWEQRRRVVDRMPVHTLSELRHLYDREKVSLGIIHPSEVLDVEIAPAEESTSAGYRLLLRQQSIFYPEQEPLKRILYRFRYVFRCEDCDEPHRLTITDWELGALYHGEVARLGNEEKAASSVRDKYLHELCAADRDTKFYVGTYYPYNTWLILGVFWPPHVRHRQKSILHESAVN